MALLSHGTTQTFTWLEASSAPSTLMFVKFRWTLWSNTFIPFGLVTFKLGGFHNFKALFPAVLVDIRLLVNS